jgi:SAM-dependent MidA family methyltransferase
MTEPRHNPELVSIIHEEIAARGPMPFARFMELALYHPAHGYYNAGRNIFGREGDYYTSVDLSPAFGRLIARQIAQMFELLGQPDDFTVVEMGAGRGFMALDILDELKSANNDCHASITYIICEQGEGLLANQKQRLEQGGHEKIVRWESFEQIKGNSITGVFLSNELVDAFPVNMVEMANNGLLEHFVAVNENELVIEKTPVENHQLTEYLDDFDVTLEPGQVAEINLAARRWMRDVAARLGRGFAITIDYGDTASALYHPARFRGTLLCYHKHALSENPLDRVGLQDITAHVNFTDLIKTGEAAGLRAAGLVKQLFFLMGLGIGDLAAEPSADTTPRALLKRNLGIKGLINPDGLGAHRVLLQYKGFDEPPGLLGLSCAP